MTQVLIKLSHRKFVDFFIQSVFLQLRSFRKIVFQHAVQESKMMRNVTIYTKKEGLGLIFISHCFWREDSPQQLVLFLSIWGQSFNLGLSWTNRGWYQTLRSPYWLSVNESGRPLTGGGSEKKTSGVNYWFLHPTNMRWCLSEQRKYIFSIDFGKQNWHKIVNEKTTNWPMSSILGQSSIRRRSLR